MTPAPVDHEERRAEIATVLIDVVAEGGLDAVSVRSVAAAAGVAIGTVQHYFPTKDAMLQHASRLVDTQISERVEARAQAADSAKAAIWAILTEILPLDDERARIIRVFLAFEARALHSPALARQALEDSKALHDALTEMFALAGAESPRQEAILAVALVGGLCQPLLLGDPACTPDDALAVLAAHLDRALPA